MEFTHLHVHTEYSLLDGSNKIKEYVARVKELGMDSAAITDHGVMYGVIDLPKHRQKRLWFLSYRRCGLRQNSNRNRRRFPYYDLQRIY